ncbi:hypothetical protein DNTS_013837, partial [Danionella cerebrum]
TFCRKRKAPGCSYTPREELHEAFGDSDTVIPNLPAKRRSAAEDDGERGRRKEKRQRRKKFWRRLCCIDGSPSRDAYKPEERQDEVLEPEAEASREISDGTISPQDIVFVEDHTSEYFDGPQSSLGQINTESSGYLSEGEIVVPTDKPDTNEEPVKQDILSQYMIGYKLGQGGFGTVNAAFRLSDNLSVAVKIAKKSESMEYINIPDHPTPVPLEVGLTVLANKGPIYCPPEFFLEGKYFGKPATVYSLGVLLFYAVCGHFPKKSDLEKLEMWEWSQGRLSKECCHLLNSCLHPNPNERIPLDELLLHDWFQLKIGGEKNFILNFH